MQFYHGHNVSHFFQFEKHITSRYGFPCIFMTDNKELALQYGKFIYTKEFHNIYATSIDFKGKVSYSLEFRNLIHQLFKEGKQSVLIKNVYDRKDESLPLLKSDILVIFNIDLCIP
ncbi:MAG TPA: hypothetical protein DDZ41_03530 [Flavobacterium sp.]|nr:hypothetical protein [Flavobacterium sp.]